MAKTREQLEEMSRKFKVIAENRIGRAIDAIRLFGKLANKRNYHYDPDQIDQIINTLQAEVDKVKEKYLTPPNNKADNTGFKFKS